MLEPIYINPYQPKRDFNAMGFRTHIPHPGYPYKIYNATNLEVHAELYRWASDEPNWANAVSQHDLHAYLFFDRPYISKRSLGQAIINSTIYNPRRLKGKCAVSDHAQQIYLWRRRLDLVYGLEWMICMWLIKVGVHPDKIEDELRFLSGAPRGKVRKTLHEYGQKLRKIREPDWHQIFEDHLLPTIPVDDQHWPDWGTPTEKRPPRPKKLQSFSRASA